MQSQESLYAQLLRLYDLANKNGLYDAADFVRAWIKQIEAKA